LVAGGPRQLVLDGETNRADLQPVAGADDLPAADALAVEERAVDAVEVLDRQVAVLDRELAVPPADLVGRDAQPRPFLPADNGLPRPQPDRARPRLSLFQEQGHVHGSASPKAC